MEKKKIERVIRSYITKHLVLHTPIQNDNRDRLDIMIEECAEELHNEFEKELDSNNPSNLASEAARQEVILKLKEKLDKQIKANGEINQTVTDLNKPIGLTEPNIYNPDSKNN